MKFSFWRRWTFASIKGSVLGAFLSTLLFLFIPIESIAALPLGFLIGRYQWKVIQSYFPHSHRWILYSTLGFITGLTVFNFIQFLTVGAFGFIPITVIGFMILGLIFGYYQRLILKQYLSETKGWLMGNAVGWSLAVYIILMLDIQMFELIKIPLEYLIIGGIVGGRTGLTLVVFLKRFDQSTECHVINDKQYKKTIGISIGTIVILNIFMMFPFQKYTSVDAFQSICKDIPPITCEGDADYCQSVVSFEPKVHRTYIDYPHVNETWENQYRSFLRRDLMMLIKYAIAQVECDSSNWENNLTQPIMLMDMSERDGRIPGSSYGQPGHPGGSHQSGNDIDIAYFQSTGSSLWLKLEQQFDDRQGHISRSVCQHTQFGLEVYRCTQAPHNLDLARTALFILYLSKHPDIRVIGVDGKIGRKLEKVYKGMVKAGQISEEKRKSIPLAYETFETGRSWFRHHHNHIHISMDR